MKKPLLHNERYSQIKQKRKKEFIPNLPNTNKLNDGVVSELGKVEDFSLFTDNQVLLRFPHLINRPWIRHDTTKKLSVIVPYRDRENHLNIFINEFPQYLERQGIDYHITVVEQANNESPFNKGMLFNAGFKETKNYDYFCLHDVDMIPLYSDYGYDINTPKGNGFFIHPARYIEKWDYIELPGCCGGVVLVDRQTYLDVNGYSISYWGWGVEDDDFKRRCQQNKTTRIINTEGIYRTLYHLHNYNPNCYVKNKKVFDSNIPKEQDGLNHTMYKVVSRKKLTDRISFVSIMF